jgi:hypothetical protein
MGTVDSGSTTQTLRADLCTCVLVVGHVENTTLGAAAVRPLFPLLNALLYALPPHLICTTGTLMAASFQ